MSSSLPPPPKYGPTAQFPSSVQDWLQFFRWLFSLYKTTTELQGLQQIPKPAPLPARGQDMGEAFATSGQKSAAPRSSEIPALALMRQRIPIQQEGLGLLAFQRPPQPQRQQPVDLGIPFGPHNDRVAQGTVNVTGTSVIWGSGALFSSDWLGSIIYINYLPYTIVGFISPTDITISSSAGTHTGLPYFFSLYPPTKYDTGQLFFETDRTVFYITEDQTFAVDTSGTSVSIPGSPAISANPYWAGHGVTINGVQYVIAFVTSATTFTLTTPAPLQTLVGCTVPAGHWQYTTGTYTSQDADQPTDLTQWDDFGFLWHSNQRAITYIGVPGVAGAFYFGYFDGIDYGGLSVIPSTLLGVDIGYLYFANDFNHLYRWDGTAWHYAPGDGGNRYAVLGEARPAPTGWVIAGGGTANVSNDDGTISSETIPNMTGNGLGFTGPIFPNLQASPAGPVGSSGPDLVTVSNPPHTGVGQGVTTGLTNIYVNDNGTPNYVTVVPWYRL